MLTAVTVDVCMFFFAQLKPKRNAKIDTVIRKTFPEFGLLLVFDDDDDGRCFIAIRHSSRLGVGCFPMGTCVVCFAAYGWCLTFWGGTLGYTCCFFCHLTQRVSRIIFRIL